MRKHPLLAFVTALITCTTSGAFTAAGATTNTANQKASTSVAATKHPKHKARHVHLTAAEVAERRVHRARIAAARARAHHLREVRHQAAVKAKQVSAAVHAGRGAKIRSRPKAAVIHPYVALGGVWAALRGCEAHGDYTENTGNGYYGAYQFSRSSWFAVGGSGLPSAATPKAQDAAALALFSRQGWHAWPACSWKIGVV